MSDRYRPQDIFHIRYRQLKWFELRLEGNSHIKIRTGASGTRPPKKNTQAIPNTTMGSDATPF